MNKSIVFQNLNKIGIALIALTAIGFATTNSASAASVTTLLQDSFEQENSTALNYDHFANWNVVNGSVDLIGSVGFYDFLPANGLYVDLDGSTGKAGTMTSKTTFNFQAGNIVNLSFQLAGNQRDNVTDSVTVSLGNLFSETFSLLGSQAFTNFTRSFTVANVTSATLDFKGIGTDNVGLLLDNVTLTKSVPEPGSIMGILGLGAFGVTSLCKRKQQAAVKA
ncbi:PEP-CTERM sorting domain-containing protein [Nostoc sp.]|uniref:PEP-CTERM sorting domain-containing protein n=1 Tax=Nostoc sp. TaxID=1180 RepID=UPI002FF9035E